ncbi:MAG: hypothetical protein ACLFQT_07805 [Thiohalophilus sp.]
MDKHLTEEEISDLVDNPDKSDTVGGLHLSECKICESRFYEYKKLAHMTGQLPRLKASRSVLGEILQALEDENDMGESRYSGYKTHFVSRFYYSAVAAVFVIGISLGVVISSGSEISLNNNKEHGFSYLATFTPLPLSYPCDDKESCEYLEDKL